MSLASGTRLGPYEIFSPLGAGGMGEVYKARDNKLDRFVAVKVISEKLAGDANALARFEREAKAVAALSHPNILAIHDFGSEGGITYAVMELLEGETLRERLARGALSASKAQDVAEQIVKGLAAAHEKGIIHRDLKPGNVFLTKDGHVKILDFGLAKLRHEAPSQSEPLSERLTAEAATRDGALLGTAGYMAPEQARGDEADAQSDIFSFGVVLYETLSGVKPFDRGSAMDTLAAILKEDPPPLPPATPPGLDRVVRRCLEKRPEERFTSANDVAFALDAVSGSTAGVSAPALPAYLAGARSRRLATGGTIGILMLVIAAIMLALYFGRGAKNGLKPFEQTKVSRLTGDGTAGAFAAISPDGRYAAYYRYDDQGRPGLWVQQVATASTVQLVPPSPNILSGLAFSRDGNYVYYSSMPPTTNACRLHRVPVLGGVPEPQPLYADTSVTFSPDAKRLACVRQDTNELWVADADGTGQKVLARGNYFRSRPDWSPDGVTLALAEQEESSFSYCLQLVDVGSGSKRVLGTRTWDGAGEVAWLPDGRGLLFVALDRTLAAETQIWLVDYPSGEARPLTKDIGGYFGVSVSADGKSVVSVRAETRSDLWVAPLDDLSKAVQVTRGYDSADGFRGLCWTPDGGLLYTSKAGGLPDLWLLDKPGGQPRRLTHDPYPESGLAVSPNGRTLLYAAVDHPGVGQTIYRMDADGSNPKQISPGPADCFPTVTPDGRWVLYCDFQHLREMRVPIEGGKPEPLGGGDSLKAKLFEGFIGNALSPDGRTLAGWTLDQGGVHLSAAPLDGSGPRTVFGGALSIQGHVVWEPDGKGLLYVYVGGGDIWRQGLDKGLPRKLTDLREDAVFRLAVSPDGKQLALSRGKYLQDVVRIQQASGEEEKN